MARTPPAPKRRTATPTRGAELHALSLKLPVTLVSLIDKIAAGEQRSRAKMIEIMLDEAARAYQRKSAA